jgi:hypothetical protein
MTPEPRKARGSYLPHHRRVATAKPPFQLQERDFAIVEAIWSNRFLTRELVAQLFPPAASRGPDRTTTGTASGSNLDRRLAKLFHHGYLDRLRTAPGTPLVYGLGQRGAALLRDRRPDLSLSEATDWREKNRDVSNLYVDHTLMGARLRTALHLATKATPATELENFEREHIGLKAEWRHGGRRFFVNPDAFFVLRDRERPDGKQRTAFFVEADRSTMTLARLTDKFQAYARLYTDREHQHAFGIPTFRVLTVAKSPERASNLLKLVRDAERPPLAETRSLFYFTSETAYAAEPLNALAAVWRQADDPTELRGIIPSPLPRR